MLAGMELSSVPPRRTAAALAVTAIVVAAIALLTPGISGTGRIGLGAVALVVGLVAGVLVAVGSAVTADAAGVLVIDGTHRRRLDWAEVTAVRVDERRRSRGLELDLGEALVVVPSYLIGDRDLEPLAVALNQLRTHGGSVRPG
jgi:Bacterial PH domain